MKFFLGGDRNRKKAEEYENPAAENPINEPGTIQCSGCGAKIEITGESACECEYCGTLLNYIPKHQAVPSEAAAKAQNADMPAIENTYTLSTGFYTAGIDIPAGKCNVTAVSGSGNILSSDDDGINEIFGTERGDVSSFKGLKLPKNVTLSISGRLTVKLVYKSIDGGLSGRTYNMAGATKISTGNYEVGADFKAGIYNIVAVSGSGNIYSLDGEVNEIFGFEDEDVREIRNVNFPKGAELSIEGDLTAKLIPAVRK